MTMNNNRILKSILLISLVTLFFLNVGSAQTWHTNYDDALQLAKAEEKPIILVFQGSDWCAPCIKLERAIWSSEEFKSHASENYVLLLADFPRKKKNHLSSEQKMANQKLAETYNKQGVFPLVVVIDANEQVKGTTGYKKLKPTEYIALLDSM